MGIKLKQKKELLENLKLIKSTHSRLLAELVKIPNFSDLSEKNDLKIPDQWKQKPHSSKRSNSIFFRAQIDLFPKEMPKSAIHSLIFCFQKLSDKTKSSQLSPPLSRVCLENLSWLQKKLIGRKWFRLKIKMQDLLSSFAKQLVLIQAQQWKTLQQKPRTN